MSDDHPFGCDCDECMTLVLDEPAAVEVAEWDRWEAATVDTEHSWAIGRPDKAAAHIERLALDVVAAEEALMVAVGMARDAGQQWGWVAGIITALGLPAFRLNSKQAAARRFAPAVERYNELLAGAREGGEARKEFVRLARAMTARPTNFTYEVRTSKRPREGELVSRHKLEGRAIQAAVSDAVRRRRSAYVFECDPRANVVPVLIHFVEDY